MENIKQLEKEIERKNKRHRKEAERLKIEPLSDGGWKDTIEPEAKLQTLQEVCEEIKKIIRDIGAEQSDKHIQGMEIFEREILKKFQGENDN